MFELDPIDAIRTLVYFQVLSYRPLEGHILFFFGVGISWELLFVVVENIANRVASKTRSERL